jgi:hypothetical protein
MDANLEFNLTLPQDFTAAQQGEIKAALRRLDDDTWQTLQFILAAQHRTCVRASTDPALPEEKRSYYAGVVEGIDTASQHLEYWRRRAHQPEDSEANPEESR